MKRGFTLIELLVVIAIIAILAAILFPVFARAREQARSSSCSSNVKQLMVAFQMYASDSDGNLPYYWYIVSGGRAWTWPEIVDPYVKNTQIHICPSAPLTATTYWATAPAGTAVVSTYCWPSWVKYSWYNWYGTTMFAGYPTGTSGVKVNAWDVVAHGMDEVDKPAEAALLVEGHYIAYYPVAGMRFGSAYTSGFGQVGNANIYRHNGGHNVGFCDGHVKFIGGQDYMTNSSARTTGTYAGRPQSPFMRVGP
ncbi:MAG: DUF1559 domain-containing protein [Armatimonadetes bacterium]|nr:DUF1559 domain-containing protein [Armatimonadota bacterium]